MSEEEERPSFITGGYGWYKRQWVKVPKIFLCLKVTFAFKTVVLAVFSSLTCKQGKKVSYSALVLTHFPFLNKWVFDHRLGSSNSYSFIAGLS